MPFSPDTVLDPNPAVKLFFSGLMIIEPAADGKTCEIFVHRSTADHHLTIDVRQKQTGKPDLIKMRHVGPLPFALAPPDAPTDPPIHGVLIEVQKAPKGVRGFYPADKDNKMSLNLALNLQSPRFHGGNPDMGVDPVTENPRKLMDVDRLRGRPSLLLNDALFYTADLTASDLTIKLLKGDTEIGELDPFASLIGANVYLDDGDSLSLQWMSQGRLERIDLQKPAADTHYEIYVINDPLYETDSLDVLPHEELTEYYIMLPNVPTAERFKLNVLQPAPQGNPAAVGRGSTRTPCMCVINDPGA
jgi:hypothetical protein